MMEGPRMMELVSVLAAVPTRELLARFVIGAAVVLLAAETSVALHFRWSLGWVVLRWAAIIAAVWLSADVVHHGA